MEFKSEKDFEDALVEYQCDTGECFIVKKDKTEYIRQFPLPGYGVLDILSINYVFNGKSPEIHLTIIELKNTQLVPSDVAQICRYKVGLIKYAKSTFGKLLKNDIITVDGILIGSYNENKADDVASLVSNINWLSAYNFHLRIDGMDIAEVEHSWDKRKHQRLSTKLVSSIKERFFEEWRDYKAWDFEEGGEK